MTPDILDRFSPERPGRLRRLAVHGDVSTFGACPLVACIPARNEAERIAACLLAADGELRPGDGVLLFANGCADETVRRALAVLSKTRRPWAILDGDWRVGEGGAPHARRLAMETAHDLSPNAALFSLDGDTLVRPGLRDAYSRAFAAGFDLVCGAIGFIPEEASLLPPADPEQQAVVREYRHLSAHLSAILDPDPDNPWPHHGNIGGANFAISGQAYAAIGGLPTPSSGEDRALRRLCEALGLRIRYTDEALVWTSCRLDGRARGGLSDELLRERREADPFVDELLEEPDRLVLRNEARRAFLGAATGPERFCLLATLGLDASRAGPLAEAGGRRAWALVEDLSPRLERRRLRLSDLRGHLPELQNRHRAIAEGRAGSPAPQATPEA